MTRRVLALLVFACLLCSPVLADVTTNTGTYNVLNNVQLGSNSTGTSKFFNGGDSTLSDGSTTHTGAALNIGDATHNVTMTLVDGNSYLGTYGGNTLTINAGSALALKTNKLPDTDWHLGYTWPTASQASLMNWNGNIAWAGKIQFQPRNLTWGNGPNYTGNDPNMVMLNNYGKIQVTGQSAVIERLPNPDGNTYYAKETAPFMNWGGTGSITGNGKLTYVNSTGNSVLDTLAIANYGVVAPGTSSAVGTLELANVYLWAGSGGSGQFRLGGTTTGTFDVLTLSGTSKLGGLGTVNISTISGFTPHYGDTWQILNYPALDNYEYITGPVDLGGGFSLAYYPTDAVLTYVPEPATLSLLAMAGLAILRKKK